MNDPHQQFFISSIAQFIARQQQQPKFDPIPFQTQFYSFLFKLIYQPYDHVPITPESIPYILTKATLKKQLLSIDIKLLVNKIEKIPNKLKYPIALTFVLLLTLNKNKSLSIILGLFYQILNAFIKQLKKQNDQKKFTLNKKAFSQQTEIIQQINQFCSHSIMKTFKSLLKLTNFDKTQQCEDKCILEAILRVHFKNSNNEKSLSIFKGSKVYKIVSSILCLPEKYLKVSQLLQGLYTFETSYPNSYEILQKIEYKLVNKLQKYPKDDFTLTQIVLLLRILLHGINPRVEPILSSLFQHNFEPQSSQKITVQQNQTNLHQKQQGSNHAMNINNKKQGIAKLFEVLISQNSYSKTHTIKQGMKKEPISFGYHLTCFIIKIISSQNVIKHKNIKQSASFIKQLVFYISTEFLHKIYSSSLNKKNIKFYNTIISTLISENDVFILKICLKFLQNQSILNFSVHKLKSLFKLLTDIAKKLKRMDSAFSKGNNSICVQTQLPQESNNNEKQTNKVKKQDHQLNEQVELAKIKISRILRILDQLSQRFKNKSPEILFQNGSKSVLQLQKIKSTNSFFFQMRVNDRRMFNAHSQNSHKQETNNYLIHPIRLVQFVLGKSQVYEVFLSIKPVRSQNKDSQRNKNSLSNSQVYFQKNSINKLDQILGKGPLSFVTDILIYKDKKIVVKEQLKNMEKIADSYFQFSVVVTCNKPTDSKGTKLLIKINDKLITLVSKQKRNEVTSLQFGLLIDQSSNFTASLDCVIKQIYFFNKQIPEALISKNDFSMVSFSVNTLIQLIGGIQSLTYKISTSSEELFQNYQKQDNLFFKKQLKVTQNLIQKRRSISFIQIFQQIGGLNSIFYILQKINKSYATHFGQKTQYFFIQLFKILRNVGANDRESFIFKELKSCYSYIFHFLILIFKRNEHLANQRNSLFVEAIFKFIMFFSSHFTKSESIKQYPLEEVLQMQLTFVKQVLCNFQLWSECSIEIQSYIFQTLQGFIKNQRYTYVLFPIDLHSKILSSVTFFYCSQPFNILKNKFEQRILLNCQFLYDKVSNLLYDQKSNLQNTYNLELLFNLLKKIIAKQNKEDLSFISQQKTQKNKGQNKQVTTRKDLIMLFQRYVHRDVNETIGLINLLLIYHKRHFKDFFQFQEKDLKAQKNLSPKQQKQNMKVSVVSLNDTKKSFAVTSPSETSLTVCLPSSLRTCSNLLNYFIKNFVEKDQIFSKINEDWGYVLGILIQFQEILLETRVQSKFELNMKPSRFSNVVEFVILSKILNSIFKIVNKNQIFYNYVMIMLEKLLMHKRLSFLEIFQIASQIISLNKRYNFDIVDTIFFLLNKKLTNLKESNGKEEIVQFLSQRQIQKILYKMADASLTYSKEFQEFIIRIKRQISTLEKSYFFQQQGFENSKIQEEKFEAKQKVQINFKQQTPKKISQINVREVENQILLQPNEKTTTNQKKGLNDELVILKSRENLKKIFEQYEDVLFSICYETASICLQNRQWIESYFSRKYSDMRQKESVKKQNLLKQKRVNSQSNFLIAYFCFSQPSVHFMLDVLQRNAQEQNQDALQQEVSSIYGYKPLLTTIQQISPRKQDSNSYTSRLSSKALSKEDFHLETYQQITLRIMKILNDFEPVSFFISNPKLNITQIIAFSKSLQQKLNTDLQSFSFLKKHKISLLSFINFYILGSYLNYLLEKYSFSQENVSEIQKPIDALKRKEHTLQIIDFIGNCLKNKQFDPQEFYNCLLTETQINSHKNQKSMVFGKENLNDQKKMKVQKDITQNLRKFIETWYLDTNKSLKINLHDKTQIKTPKKLNLEQKNIFDTFFDKIKFICFQNLTDDQKVNELFAFMSENTRGNLLKSFVSLMNKVIFTLKYVIQYRHLLCFLQNYPLFNKQYFAICSPKNPAQIVSQKMISQYRQQITIRFNKILQVQRRKGEKCQKEYRKNEKENQFWLQIEEKQFERKDVIYEIDEKQIGPFGFYKLNIKPSEDRVQQIHYPRKKMFASIKDSDPLQENQQQQNMEIQDSILLNKTRLIEMSMDNNYLEEKNQRRNTLLQISPLKIIPETGNQRNSIPVGNFSNSSSVQFICEWVTKRGVYAGKLVVKPQWIEFKYLSHLRLPQESVYQLSTGKFHQINSLTEQERSFISSLRIPFKRCRMFTRRYILRHTAVQLFSKSNHQSYFFNLFYFSERQRLISITKQKFEDCLQDRKQQFERRKFTQQWQIGQLSNFQYLCLINQYSGRSTNDLAQYYVFPWVITNYNGKNGYKQIDEDFLSKRQNIRDLSAPPGKLNQQKFNKLKMRLMELDFCEPEERFLYGTMFSNPTVLYNFFIRLEPYIHLHWEHQGKRIDHADRLFSSIQEQFSSVLIASSDMKELTPEFYYWPEFLKNRSYIDLGLKQNKQPVDDVILPVWAHTPEQFIFKMRQVLESNIVSQHLHEWIDLTFGYKIKYENAEKFDNLYHFNCYERQADYFQEFDGDEKQIRSLQVSISQFGQIPQAVFDQPHPQKNIRHEFLIIDKAIHVKFQKSSSSKTLDQNHKRGFQTCKEGLFLWTSSNVEFKKSYINQNYSYDEEHRVFSSIGSLVRLLSFEDQCWLTLNQGILRIYLKRVLKYQSNLEAQCIDVIGTYFIYSKKSSLFVSQYEGNMNKIVSLKTLFGHKDEIIFLTCSKQLDLILSVDLQGFVIIHELQNLSFLRNFQLPLEKEWSRNQFYNHQEKKRLLKVQIHQMGYFIFILNQRKLVIMTYYFYQKKDSLERSFQNMTLKQFQKQEGKDKNKRSTIFQFSDKINQFWYFFTHFQLLGTDKGNIYEIDFIDIKRYNEIFPHKTFTNIQNNILELFLQHSQSSVKKSQVSKGSSNKEFILKPIERMAIQKIAGDKISLYQLIVQYEDGEIMCFYEEKYLGKQLKQNQKLKQIGLFF